MIPDERLWNWNRYWLPHSSFSRLLISGFLPSTPLHGYVTLEQLSDKRLLVLLGEPGSGKSVEVARERDRVAKEFGPKSILYLDGRTTIHSEYILYRLWFDSESWRRWLHSSDRIWVFFDGFDEAAQRISNLAGIITHELNNATGADRDLTTRISLRAASRTSQWQLDFGRALYRALHPPGTSVTEPDEYTFHLAPPRWDDIEVAASSRGLDGILFQDRIRKQGIEALALRPVQLEWLLNVFGAGGQLPEDKDQLYWEGMRQLCQDRSLRSGADQLRSLALQVAFVTVFGGIDSVWLDVDRGDIPNTSIPLSNLANGLMLNGGGVPETSSAMLDLVASGLFTSAEPNQATWAHQSYPEYLAAKLCAAEGMPLSQVIGLITNPLDLTQKVLPDKVETAAWLAVLSPPVLEHLLEHDPSALVESDVALGNSADRERLLHAFLAAIEEHRWIRTSWPKENQFRWLSFPGIGPVIRSYITNKTRREETRQTGIDIAVDCHCAELADVLASVALDQSESVALRSAAAWAVTILGDSQTKRSIKPLVSLTLDEDPEEDLKGYAMLANWPTTMAIDELLHHLAVPKRDTGGIYQRFITSSFVKNLADDDLVPSLKWFDNQGDWGQQSYDLSQIELDLVSRAMLNLGNPDVLEWTLKWIASNLRRSHSLFGEGMAADILSGFLTLPERRRTLVKGLSRTIIDPNLARAAADNIVDLFKRDPAWHQEDFPWIVGQLHDSTEGTSAEAFWLQVLWYSVSLSDVNQISTYFDLYSNDRFTPHFAAMFAPIAIDSPEAERQKRTWYAFFGRPHSTPREPKPKRDVDEQVQRILAQLNHSSPLNWWMIDDQLKIDDRGIKHEAGWVADVSEQPGWNLCASATQQRVIETAPAFLNVYDPHTEHIGTSGYYLSDHSAYRALTLLLRERPDELDCLPDEAWIRLGPIILGMHPRSSGTDIPNQRTFLEKAIERGFKPVPWLVNMAARGANSAYYFSPAMEAVASLSTEEDLPQLVEELIRYETPFPTLREAVKVLVEKAVVSAFAATLKVVATLAEDQSTLTQAAELVAVVMDYVNESEWKELWRPLAANDLLFEEALLTYSYRHPDTLDFARRLDEPSLARLYLKLADRFPPSDDPSAANKHEMHEVTPRESLGRWREDLLSSLTLRGSWEAVEQVRLLANRLPNIEWLSIRIAQAEEEARRRTWHPPSVDQLMKIVRLPKSRLVNSPQQLSDVVIESLVRYQTELSAESPATADLWNSDTRTPKEEVEISNHIKRFLDRDLKESGIIINREVENRIQNQNDLYIQCIDPASNTKVTIVCEVKGCWHRHLYKSMATQLYERYMKQQGLSYGIYVVAYFDGDRWESNNFASRHKARKHSFAELQNSMAAQASELSGEVFQIAPVVLDCRY